MKVYNTLTRKIEEFVPNEKGKIKMYTCGPTVYDHQHIGNLRSHVSEDLFEKAFEYLGYKVKRAMVITDIGKLNKDGEDKIINAMFKEKNHLNFLLIFIQRILEMIVRCLI